jgi:hypothetical protein
MATKAISRDVTSVTLWGDLEKQLAKRHVERVGQPVEPIEVGVILPRHHGEEFASVDPSAVGHDRQWDPLRFGQATEILRHDLVGRRARHPRTVHQSRVACRTQPQRGEAGAARRR